MGTIAGKTRSTWTRASFRGNPYATITAIDTSGGILLTRTSGSTPFFVHVSAAAITATGTTRPYEDLEFKWDFGDPSGTEVFTNPADGTTVNANTNQYGPEAAYVYRNAGTYTITLTVRGANGSGGYVTATTTSLIVRNVTRIQLGSPTAGTYTVTVNGTTTAPIAYNATAPTRLAAIQTAIGAGNARYAGSNNIEFCGALSGTNPTVTVDSSGLTGATVTVTTTNTGAAAVNAITVSTFSGTNGDWWYDGTSGNDSNDGLDPWGFALSGATWTAATKTLTKTGAFTNYNHTAATAPTNPIECYNYIRLTGGTGITAGLYQIASKVSNDAITLVASAGASDSTNVTSSTGPKLTGAHFATQNSASNLSNNLRFRFRRGTVITTTSSSIQLDRGNTRRTHAYGSGANPILRYTGTSTSSFLRLLSGDDKVLSNIDFDGNSLITTDIVTAAGGIIALSRWGYFDGCRAYGLASGGSAILWDFNGGATTVNLFDIGLWNCTCEQTTGTTKHSFFGYIASWGFLVGCSFSGSGANAVLDHHVYYDQQGSYGLLKWLDFGTTSVRNYCINGNCSDDVNGVSEFALFSECDMTYTQRGFDLSNSTNSRSAHGSFKNCVAEGNALHGLTADGSVLYYNADTVTIRDNVLWSNTGGACLNIGDSQSSYSIYGNKIYHNVGYCLSDSTASTARFFKGNDLIVTTAAPAQFVSLGSNAGSGLSSDSNDYYSPNDANGRFVVSSANDTFAQWQALGFDVSGLRVNRNYIDPANGNWSTTYIPTGGSFGAGNGFASTALTPTPTGGSFGAGAANTGLNLVFTPSGGSFGAGGGLVVRVTNYVPTGGSFGAGSNVGNAILIVTPTGGSFGSSSGLVATILTPVGAGGSFGAGLAAAGLNLSFASNGGSFGAGSGLASAILSAGPAGGSFGAGSGLANAILLVVPVAGVLGAGDGTPATVLSPAPTGGAFGTGDGMAATVLTPVPGGGSFGAGDGWVNAILLVVPVAGVLGAGDGMSSSVLTPAPTGGAFGSGDAPIVVLSVGISVVNEVGSGGAFGLGCAAVSGAGIPSGYSLSPVARFRVNLMPIQNDMGIGPVTNLRTTGIPILVNLSNLAELTIPRVGVRLHHGDEFILEGQLAQSTIMNFTSGVEGDYTSSPLILVKRYMDL